MISAAFNQIEIYFLDRAAQAADAERFRDARGLGTLSPGFQHRYQTMDQPFQWTFTRADLQKLLAKLAAVQPAA
jgi:hypothetical protein